MNMIPVSSNRAYGTEESVSDGPTLDMVLDPTTFRLAELKQRCAILVRLSVANAALSHAVKTRRIVDEQLPTPIKKI